MIRYTLVCNKRHEFESWFTNSAAYDKQAKRGLVTCPLCGSAKVEKALMAPRLGRADAPSHQEAAPAQPSPPHAADNREGKAAPAAAKAPTPVAMISPQEQEFRQKLRELRDHLGVIAPREMASSHGYRNGVSRIGRRQDVPPLRPF